MLLCLNAGLTVGSSAGICRNLDGTHGFIPTYELLFLLPRCGHAECSFCMDDCMREDVCKVKKPNYLKVEMKWRESNQKGWPCAGPR